MSTTPDDMSDPLFLYFENLPSTNQKLKELTEKGYVPDMSMVITKHQTAGRGQLGNKWESEDGKNLTFSFALNPTFLLAQQQFALSQLVSLGLVQAITQMGIANARIKWPNDIYVSNKKLAGILIENSIMGNNLGCCIIGIGLNVNQTEFLSNAPNPVSLAQISGKPFNLNEVLENILDAILEWYLLLKEEGPDTIEKHYLLQLYLHDGQFHPFKDKEGNFEGKIIGIDMYGRLIIEKKGKAYFTYEFKEVEYCTANK